MTPFRPALSRTPLIVALSTGLLLSACGGSGNGGADTASGDGVNGAEAATAPRDLPAAALAPLDSGNAAYRRGSYEQALRHYLRVTEIDPEGATGWFGVYMAHTSLGNGQSAAEALEKAQAASPDAALGSPHTPDSAAAEVSNR